MKRKQLVFCTVIMLHFSFPAITQTTLEEVIGDMTLPHEGKPHGVPSSYDWANGPRYGAEAPPDHWDAAITWGQLYEWAEGNPATNTRVQIRDLEMYYLSKSDLEWHQLQSDLRVDGAAYVEDFQGDINRPADIRTEEDGSVSVTAGEGYNFHFWPSQGRISYPKGDIKGVFTTVRARLIMDDPGGTDDRDSARYVMGVGGDWWESLTAVWDNWTTNADMGIGRFRFVHKEWKSFNMISLPEDSIRKYPPPFHVTGPDDATGIPPVQEGNSGIPGLRTYPNPSGNQLYVDHECEGVLSLEWLSVSGTIIHTGILESPGFVDTGMLEKGLYLLRIKGPDTRAISKILIN